MLVLSIAQPKSIVNAFGIGGIVFGTSGNEINLSALEIFLLFCYNKNEGALLYVGICY